MRFRLRRRATTLAACSLLHGSLAAQPTVEPAAEPLHWSAHLGNRIAAVEHAFPLVDRVVLVPDTATYLDELSRWSPKGRWPVLIEDRWSAPRFVRAFKPAQLLRRARVATKAPGGDDLRAACDAVVRRAWGSNSPDAPLRDVFAASTYTPQGMVFASTDDPAWTAAVALAASRGQPIAWLEGAFGRPNDLLTLEQSRALRDAVAQGLDQTGLPWRTLGDAIEAVTICRAMGHRVPIEPGMQIPSPKPEDRAGGLATTDLLGRAADGSRGAFCGWIFGDAANAAWSAMSSLFLPRGDAILFSGYEDTAPWSEYAVLPASDALRRAGWATTVRDGPSAGQNAWRAAQLGGWPFDLGFVNSSGNAGFFNLAGGQRLGVGDIPVLNRPMALHVIHSWSLQFPQSASSVGGRFLANGAYAYIGAVEEPYLPAFVPPSVVVERLATGAPLLVAARHWDGAGSLPWRVCTIGDPLMLCPPRERDPRRRIAVPGDAAPHDGQDLRLAVKELMRRAASAKEPAAAAAALRIIDMLGDDAVARGFLGAAQAGGYSDASVSEAALPALFRLGDADGFMSAWIESIPRDGQLLDMLWQLVPGKVGAGATPEMLAAMEQSLRREVLVDDAATLFRLITDARGPNAAMAYLARAVDRMPDEASRQRLRDAVK